MEKGIKTPLEVNFRLFLILSHFYLGSVYFFLPIFLIFLFFYIVDFPRTDGVPTSEIYTFADLLLFGVAILIFFISFQNFSFIKGLRKSFFNKTFSKSSNEKGKSIWKNLFFTKILPKLPNSYAENRSILFFPFILALLLIVFAISLTSLFQFKIELLYFYFASIFLGSVTSFIYFKLVFFEAFENLKGRIESKADIKKLPFLKYI